MRATSLLSGDEDRQKRDADECTKRERKGRVYIMYARERKASDTTSEHPVIHMHSDNRGKGEELDDAL